MITSSIKKTLFFCLQFYRHFSSCACFTRAGSLAFSTILSIVPLIVVSVGALSLLPFSHFLETSIQDFIFNNFVASSGAVIQQYIQEFVANVSQLSWYSIIFLIITALDILFSIELSLNAIWQTNVRRHWFKAIILYLLVLLITPLLFFLSLGLTFIMVNFYIPHWLEGLLPIALMKSLPLIFSLIIFLLIFKGMPHCRVHWSSAFGGAFVSAVLFESAKIIFAWYVQAFPTYRIIYGAVAALPIFLIWIYICWVVLFVGAVTSYMLQHRKTSS